MDMAANNLVIAERDAMMYELRKSGATFRQIAKQMKVSEGTAYNGVKRMEQKIMRRFALDHAAEARRDLERMDDMLRSFLPLTKPQKMEVGGEEIVVPPSTDAGNMVMKIIAQRAKMLGYEAGDTLNINVTGVGGGAPATGEEKATTEVTPEAEVRELLKVMTDAGVLDPSMTDVIQAMMPGDDDDIEDAEIVETDVEDVEPIHDDVPDEPPEIVDEYDEEFPDQTWTPS